MQMILEQAQPEKMKERISSYVKKLEQTGKEKKDGSEKNSGKGICRRNHGGH